MFKLKIMLGAYTDTVYVETEDQIVKLLISDHKARIIEVGYAYKHLGAYWQVDPCWLTIDGKYKTLKQLSRDYLGK